MKPRRFTSLARALRWIRSQGQAKSLHMITLHDDGCLHSRTHACTCSPEFVIEKMTVENLLRGEREQQKWLDRHTRN